MKEPIEPVHLIPCFGTSGISAAGQPRMPEASGIGDWGRSAKEAMTTFRLSTIPCDSGRHQRVDQVQLCLEEHLISEEELPALTPPCSTQEEVEDEFERVIAAIRKKKNEAMALIARHKKRRVR